MENNRFTFYFINQQLLMTIMITRFQSLLNNFTTFNTRSTGKFLQQAIWLRELVCSDAYSNYPCLVYSNIWFTVVDDLTEPQDLREPRDINFVSKYRMDNF